MNVQLVWHIHHFELPQGVSHRDESGVVINLVEDEDVKIIGIYSSGAAADRAIARARLLEGFREEPDCFIVNEFTVDKDKWTDGFATV
jgi:hypothetical protein